MKTKSETIACPFPVYIDTAETQPYPFTGLKADAAQKNKLITIEKIWQCLGRYPNSLGDYSNWIGRCHVERKSLEDAHGTLLGWGERRERFESELTNLAAIEAGAVIFECSFDDLILFAPAHGKKTAEQNAKALHRTVIAYQQDYKVPFIFCNGRRMAELTTFRWMERFWRKQQEKIKAESREHARELAKTTQQLLSTI